MRFGAHSYIFTDQWTDDSLPILDTVKNLGLQSFEIGIGDDVIFTPGLTRQKAEPLGLELVVSPGGLWPLECDLSSESADQRKAGLDWHKKQVDLAHELGATAYCGSLYGHTGVVKRHPPTREEYIRIADGLHRLADYGLAKEVAIVIEPMSHFRTNLVNKPEQALELVKMADHSNLHILLDTYHMVVEVRDFGAAIRLVGDHLWGLHACENDRGAPGGGILPWQDIFDALRTIHFDGCIAMEAYNSSIPGFAWQRGMFHNVCPDPCEFVQQGLAFLKQGLAQ
jgi:D-psicose/D-tagatose/L-ribulose 3-epimerase